MGLHDVLGQQEALRDVLRDGAGHVVALRGVDDGVLVRVLLLRLLVRAVDEGEDFAVRRVVLALQLLDEAVLDVLLGDGAAAGLHDLRFDDVLDLLHVEGALVGAGELLDLRGDAVDAGIGQLVGVIHGRVGLADGGGNLCGVEYGLGSVSLDDVHGQPLCPFLVEVVKRCEIALWPVGRAGLPQTLLRRRRRGPPIRVHE